MNQIRILLIEDDEDDCVIIREKLSEIVNTAYAIKWIRQYEEAMEALNQAEYDVCLLDYRLNGHNGLELLNALEDKDVQIPIIFLTGQGDYEVDIQAMKSGASDYLVKDDLTTPLLERTIRYAIERAKDRKALQKAHTEMEQKVRERTAELAEANEALKKHSEKIQNFAYFISHDLKSPVAGLYGLTRRLHENYFSMLDERGKTYCDHILQASEKIVSLVDKINLYVSAKESPVKIEDVDLGKTLKIIKDEFSDRFNECRISWSEPERPGTLRADNMAVIRVLRNLVDNALKYGGDSLSRIKVAFDESEAHYILSVQDNGAGVDDEDSFEIFDLFSRKNVDGTREGCGLGLAIVKEIAERHKGRVWVEKTALPGFKVCVSFSKRP